MKKKWIKVINLSVLVCILVLTVFLFWIVQGSKSMQVTVGLLLSLLYVTWGLIHHAMIGDLYPKVVVEYLLVGAIAVTIIITVVWI